jgi:YHS domain-containing protein
MAVRWQIMVQGGEKEMAIDPVCKMNVDENKAAAKYDYKGKTYYFYAAGCKDAFSKDPEKFLKKGEK